MERVAWNKGKPWSEEIKQKLSESHKGKVQSFETIEKRRMNNTGKKRTEETKRKMSLSNKGKKHIFTEESRLKVSMIRKGKHNSPNTEFKKGSHLSEETKERLRVVKTGRKLKPLSEEAKKRISISKKGCVSNRKGVKLSNETKHLISIHNAHWLGGISFEPYSMDWTNTLRRSIRERDHYTCKMCGTQFEERSFPIHHIDYDKKNCNPDNLITLCVRCHMKTNSNREFWKIYFSNINRR